MEGDEMQFRVTADIDPLKRSMSEIDQLFSELDRNIVRHAQSIARTLSQLISGYMLQGSRTKRSTLEQLASPLFTQVISGVTGAGTGKNSSQQPVNIAMNIATPDANSFRMSQGQILAETAAAIARATRRYL